MSHRVLTVNCVRSFRTCSGDRCGRATRWSGHLPVRYVRRRTALDQDAPHAGGDRLCRSKTALSVGLKVDADALPAETVAALKAGKVDLTSPAVTIELIRLNAVVGVAGKVGSSGQLTSIGITCALCHSTVDDSFMPGIGRRLDGWANTRFERRCDRRVIARAGRGAEDRTAHVGTRKIRSTAPCIRRHEHHSVEQPVAAGRDSADLWAAACRL